MSIPVLVSLVIGWLLAESPQAAVTFDTLLGAVTAKYGGTALDVTNAELTGTVTNSADQTAAPFTLTFQKQSVRLEMKKTSGTVISIRQDGRVQETRGGRIGYPDRVPLFLSAMNLSPVFALLSFSTDSRFTGSVLTAKDGAIGLKFVEGTPPGFTPPAFPQPKLNVTFWLTAAYLIDSASYGYENNKSVAITYVYTHDLAVPGNFLQPNKVELLSGTKSVWRGEVSKTRNNLTLPSDFFKILENRERKLPSPPPPQ
jgi:hypothetical protein